MFWPYVFLTFVVSVLLKAGHNVAAAVALAAAVLYFITDFQRTPRKFLPVILLGILLGTGLYLLRAPLLGAEKPLPEGEADVTGVSRKSVVIRNATGQKLRLTGIPKEKLPAKHARIYYRCELQDVPESSFMVFEHLSGVKAWCRMLDLRVVQKPAGLISDFRATTLKSLYARLDLMSQRSLIAAFLLGDTEDLTAEELDAFRDMGLMHLFAVSGLNIALLFAILYLPFRFAGLPVLGSALGYTVATAFLLLLDFPVPLLRAWLFMTIGLGMRLLDRRIPPWLMLYITAIIIELLFPLSTFSMSFILSFGVTAAILIFYEPLRFCFAAENRYLNLSGEHIALTMSAGVPALILSFLLFGTAQPLSLIYNLVLVPFSGLYLFAALLFLIFEPVKYVLAALDKLYLSFAGWHTQHVSALFPSADRNLQWLSLAVAALLLILLYILKRRHRLWSARRNLRYVLPGFAIILVLPFLFATYPAYAIYAAPNKVWIYNERRIFSAGALVFADGKQSDPRACFPVKERREASGAQILPEVLMVQSSCFIFTGRMKPEAWPQNALASCQSLHVFQSKKTRTPAKEWAELFRLFGYNGEVSIRRFFTWYGDRPEGCVREKL